MSNILEIDSLFTNLKQKVIDLESDMMEERKAKDATIAALRAEVERWKKENEQLNLGWHEMLEWMHAIVKGEKMGNGDYPHLGVCSRSRSCPTYDCSVCAPRPYKEMKARCESAEAKVERVTRAIDDGEEDGLAAWVVLREIKQIVK